MIGFIIIATKVQTVSSATSRSLFKLAPEFLCRSQQSLRLSCFCQDKMFQAPRHVPDPDTDPAATPRRPDSFQWEAGFSNHNLGTGVLAPTRLVTMCKLFLGAELEKNLKKHHVHSASPDSNSGVQALFNYANCLCLSIFQRCKS